MTKGGQLYPSLINCWRATPRGGKERAGVGFTSLAHILKGGHGIVWTLRLGRQDQQELDESPKMDATGQPAGGIVVQDAGGC